MKALVLAVLVAAGVGLGDWRVFGAHEVPPRQRWLEIAGEVAACTQREVHVESVIWFTADSIMNNADGMRADALQVSLGPTNLIFLTEPDDGGDVRHELLHVAGFVHSYYGEWLDTLAKECM